MRDALIVDGVRTPRGKGKPTGSLHDIHPQELLAQVLNALVARNGFDPTDVDDVVIGNVERRRRPRHLHRTARGARRRMAGRGARAHAEPVLRLGPAGRRRSAPWGARRVTRSSSSRAASSRCRAGPMRKRPARLHRAQRAPPRAVPAGPAGDLRRPHRDARGLLPRRTSTRSRCRARSGRPRRQAEGRFDGSLVPVYHADGSLALDHDEHLRPGTTLEALAGLSPSFAKMGTTVFEGFDRSFDEMCRQAYPQVDHVEHVHHAATRRASSTAPRRSCWRRTTTRRRTASRPGPGS